MNNHFEVSWQLGECYIILERFSMKQKCLKKMISESKLYVSLNEFLTLTFI